MKKIYNWLRCLPAGALSNWAVMWVKLMRNLSNSLSTSNSYSILRYIMARKLELKGKRFGRWTVLNRQGSTKYGEALWNCVCDCGTKRLVRAFMLVSNKSKSCGCTTRETATTHGLSKTRQYRIWQAMKTRCTNTKQPNYKRYGDRGIIYDPHWETFENFWNDMKSSYADTLTLERIDNSKGYSKRNCRWVTPAEQNMNMRSNLFIKYKRTLLTVAAASRLTGLSTTTIYNRKQRGWSDKKTLSTPAMKKFANKT